MCPGGTAGHRAGGTEGVGLSYTTCTLRPRPSPAPLTRSRRFRVQSLSVPDRVSVQLSARAGQKHRIIADNGAGAARVARGRRRAA